MVGDVCARGAGERRERELSSLLPPPWRACAGPWAAPAARRRAHHPHGSPSLRWEPGAPALGLGAFPLLACAHLLPHPPVVRGAEFGRQADIRLVLLGQAQRHPRREVLGRCTLHVRSGFTRRASQGGCAACWAQFGQAAVTMAARRSGEGEGAGVHLVVTGLELFMRGGRGQVIREAERVRKWPLVGGSVCSLPGQEFGASVLRRSKQVLQARFWAAVAPQRYEHTNWAAGGVPGGAGQRASPVVWPPPLTAQVLG